MPEIVNGIT